MTNLRLIRDKNSCPIGKGTLHDTLLNISASTRERAIKLNHLESERLQRIRKLHETNKRHSEFVTGRVMERTYKSLQDLQAYQYVLNNDYRFAQFKTMDPQIRAEALLASRTARRAEAIHTPRTARRYKMETRIYHVGYDMNSFRPEINRRLRQTDPTRISNIYKKVLLEKFKKESDLVIDRRISHSGFYRMLEDKHNVKDYAYTRLKSTVRFQDDQASQGEGDVDNHTNELEHVTEE